MGNEFANIVRKQAEKEFMEMHYGTVDRYINTRSNVELIELISRAVVAEEKLNERS